MLPALTVARPRLARRGILGALSLALSIGAIATTLPQGESTPVRGLSDEMAPSTWAMRVPTAWLGAPVPSVRRADSLDLFAVRGGDRVYAVAVAYGVTVMSTHEDGLVLELRSEDAIAIATAHASGLLLVPLLRSSR